jgi:autonomous glycyl radical cofactor GrcA
MFNFKFLVSNIKKDDFIDIIFKEYLDDLNDIVYEMIDYHVDNSVITNSGEYYITNVSYQNDKVYTRAICYPNEYPKLMIRMSTFPNEIQITMGERNNPLISTTFQKLS